MQWVNWCTAAVWQDFPRKFPRKVTVMYWRHLCEFKTLPTYILFLSVLWKNILCLDQEEKWKRKSNQVKTNINFCFFGHYYHERKYQISLSIPSLNYYYLICVSHSRNKNSQNYKDRRNYSCEKIRKLDFDIILITYLLYMALMLCFGQKIRFSVLQDSADQYIHLSTNYYFQIWLFLPCTVFFSMLKRDHIGEK